LDTLYKLTLSRVSVLTVFLIRVTILTRVSTFRLGFINDPQSNSWEVPPAVNFSILGCATYVVLVFASTPFSNDKHFNRGNIRTCRMSRHDSRALDCEFETVGDFSSEKICEDKREVAKYLVDCLINNLCDTGSGEGEDPFRTE